MSGSTSTTAPTASWTQPIEGYRSVPTVVGETIQGFAYRVTGNASNWTKIVALNALTWPYLTNVPELLGEGVALAGSNSLRIIAASPSASGVSDPGDLFGTDVAIVGGDLTATATGDFGTVAGGANLVQALTNRLGVWNGDLVFHPDYGCSLYKLLGKANSPTDNQLAAAFASTSVGADPRISSVQNATAVIVGDACQITMTLISSDGRRLPFGGALSTSVSTINSTPAYPGFGSFTFAQGAFG